MSLLSLRLGRKFRESPFNSFILVVYRDRITSFITRSKFFLWLFHNSLESPSSERKTTPRSSVVSFIKLTHTLLVILKRSLSFPFSGKVSLLTPKSPNSEEYNVLRFCGERDRKVKNTRSSFPEHRRFTGTLL